MYLRKIMVCNVTRFAYNRGTPGGALYLGSPKDRCVSDTCEKKIPDDYYVKISDEVRTRYASMHLVVQNMQNVYSNLYSQAVTHPSTNGSQPCLTSVIGRELVYSR